eukprot:GHVR01191212.1.p1 GENE.GHVR01191212.1~~GHVR01191212.1.p1  ORF type:complete len:113 (-),score=4.16 GHVR01191212.1:28-366(-)
MCCYFKMIEQTEYFGPRQFEQCLNVIFGIGVGFIKNSVGNHPHNYQDVNSYNSRGEYDYSYYENQRNQTYMNQINSYNYGSGPLYQYLQQQPNGYILYPEQQQQQQHQSRRY